MIAESMNLPGVVKTSMRDAPFVSARTHSAALAAVAALIAQEPLTQITVSQCVWAYIKAKHLHDAITKRAISADAPLNAAFDQASVDMFEMTWLINARLQ